MGREPGLYVTLLSDNRIKKILTDENGEETESEVSIAEELLKYSDMLYEPYENLMLYAGSLLEEEALEADEKVFVILQHLLSSLYECNPMSAEILYLHIINEGRIEVYLASDKQKTVLHLPHYANLLTSKKDFL